MVVIVPAWTTSGPGPSTSVSSAKMSPLIVLCSAATVGAPSVGSSTTNTVLPMAPVNESSPATGGSLTQVTVTDTVAVDPPLSV